MVRVVGVALGAAVLGAVPRRVSAGDVTSHLVPKPNPPSPTAVAHAPLGGDVAMLFGELRAGARLGSCTVVSIHDPVEGAIPVVLTTASGQTFQLDVLRRARDDDAVPSVATTSSFEVSVCNGGDGAHATDEEQGLAAVALAELLVRREAAGAKVPALLTLREREQRAAGRVLRLRV